MESDLPNGFLYGILAIFFFLMLACFLFVKVGRYCEESPNHTLKLLKAVFGAVLFVHISLLSDGESAPWFEIITNIVCHCVYALQMLSFPRVSLNSATSIGCLIAFALSHLVWLHHFQSHTGEDMVTLVIFYFVMVYLVPFTLAASVEVSEFELPTMYSFKSVSPTGITAPIKQSNSNNSFTSSLNVDSCSPRVGVGCYSPPHRSYDKYK